MAHVENDQFHGCCGIGVLYNLQGDTEYDSYGYVRGYEKATLEGAQEALQEQIDAEIHHTESNEEGDEKGYGLVLYAAAEDQTLIIQALKAKKFSPLLTFVNPRTEKKITLYGLTLCQPRAKRAAKKRAG